MAENEEVEEGKKSSKTIIIIAVIVLLLGGGGAGYFFMAGDSAETEGEKTEQVDESEAEAESEEFYSDLEKPLVVNFPKGSSAKLIQVSVTLLIKGGDTVEALKKHQPMIRNNLLMKISAKDSKNLASREGKEELRAEMLEEIGNIMKKMTGENNVVDVFFTTFVMQ